MTITIISVGAKPQPETTLLVQDFLKRLPKHIRIEWRYLKHGAGTPAASKHQESEMILRAIPRTSSVILLDESGIQVSSPELSHILFDSSQDICLIIGGAYGVTEAVKKKAGLVWSLGKLVYPHQLVRVIVAEQIYRAHCIHIGHPYHHA